MYHGVPVIGIPFVTDQENNMIKAVSDGYAIKLNWNNIDEDKLHTALIDILNDPKYVSRLTPVVLRLFLLKSLKKLGMTPT